MNQTLPLLCFVTGILIASNCVGQCHSGGRYRPLPAPAVVAYPNYNATVAPQPLPRRQTQLDRPAETATNTQANQRLTRPPMANRTLEPAAPMTANNGPQPIPAAGIQTAANGAVLRIAMDTGRWPQGMAILNINGMSMMIKPQQWEPGWVQVELPRLLIDQAVDARMFIAANPETVLEELRFAIEP